MRILIVGSDANAYTLAKKMNQLEQVDLVFVAPGNRYIKDFANLVDIHPSSVDELLEFAKANEINLTIVIDEEAIQNSIANVFSAQGLNIFAPNTESSRIILNKSSSKKTLYKLRIQTPKFGIFDKENMAVEYARKSKYPIVIKNDCHIPAEKPSICNTFPKAKYVIETLFDDFNKKIIIEDYVDAREVSLYVICDGYSALPIARVCSRNLQDQIKLDKSTNFENIAYSPDHTITKELEAKIMSRVVYPVMNEIAKHSSPYTGILGIDLLISGNNFQVIEFNSFFKSIHLQAVMPLIKSDLYDLFLASVLGSLSDDYAQVDFYDNSSIALELKSNISHLVDLEPEEDIELAFNKNGNLVITAIGSTLNIAKSHLIDILKTSGINDSSIIDEIDSMGESKL